MTNSYDLWESTKSIKTAFPERTKRMNEVTKPEITIALIGLRGTGKSVLLRALAIAFGASAPETVIVPPTKQSFLGKLFSAAPNVPSPGRNVDEVQTLEMETNGFRLKFADCRAEPGYIQKYKDKMGRIDGAVLVVDPSLGADHRIRDSLGMHDVSEAQRAGASEFIVFLNMYDVLRDDEVFDLTEMEVREQLNSRGLSGDSLPVIRGSALAAVSDAGEKPMTPGRKAIADLVAAIESQVS